MSVPDASWAPLRDAIPSFAESWDAYRSSSLYSPEETFSSLNELARHVFERVRAGDTGELPAFFDAVERLYADADDSFEEAIRIGLFEYLQLQAHQSGVPLVTFVRWLGPVSREGWEGGLKWWGDFQGVVPIQNLSATEACEGTWVQGTIPPLAQPPRPASRSRRACSIPG